MFKFEGLPKYVKQTLREKAVNVQPVGRQLGSDRFPILRQKHWDRDELPRIKQWRLNLTALSKVSNLYFVAYSDRIYVYRPNFPDQSLPLKPAIILKPVQTPGAQPGYVDEIQPHSINNLIIDFFGNLEIILVAFDDGDVIGYYTHKIIDAIDRLSVEEEIADLSFFTCNVGMSAWGLSVHSQGRKIAISSNTTMITIFAMGLACDSTLPRPVPEDLLEWHKSVIADPKWRGDDQKFVLGKWGHNIPAVAFCNNDEDIEGRLLAFGDIKGNIYILDLHKLKPVEKMRTGFCRRYSGYTACHCADDSQLPHAIWGLCWLDRKLFHEVSKQITPGEVNTGFISAWNGTEKRYIIPDTNPDMTFWPLKTLSSGSSQPLSQVLSPQQSEAEEAADTSGIENAWTEKMQTPKGKKTGSKSTHYVCDTQDLKWLPTRRSRRDFRTLGVESINNNTRGSSELYSFEENPQPDPHYRDANHPCPLFVASKTDACLIQPRDYYNEVTPIIGYLDPLGQAVILENDQPRWFWSDTPMDRFTLQAHIPELGVLIIGTPKGRVAVFTLCQSNDKADGSPVYFHRLDWILPFESQENNGERPLEKLIGIAAGPMQGQFGIWDGVARRKWRLMLHYKNFTILSYEVAKEGENVVFKDGISSRIYRQWKREDREEWE